MADHHSPPDPYLFIVACAGPAFIKWGQWAATRHDMFPPDLCLELEQLHTQAPAHGWDYTRKAVAAAFGLSVEELFDEVEAKPLASGSIGQVGLGQGLE